MNQMKLRVISRDDASNAWIARFRGEDFEESQLVYSHIPEDDSLQTLSVIELDELVEELENIKDQFSNGEGCFKGKSHAESCDAAVVEPVHRVLSKYATPYQLSHVGFWQYLSNIACQGFFWNFISWRYSGSDKQSNWGMVAQSSLAEIYFYRAWARGHRMYDQSLADPYEFAKKGAVDNWRSHILRVEQGFDQEFVKAFFVVVDEDKIKAPDIRNKLIPAIKIWQSNAGFFSLSYEEAKTLLRHIYSTGI